MDILNQDDLRRLVEISDDICVSLYLPTHRTGREQQQDPIRLKNLIAEAQEKLLEYGFRRPEVENMLRPAENLLADDEFWQHQSDGLAMFLSTEFTQYYRLPSKFEELVVIARNFHIKPLLPLLDDNGQFYILTVSLNKIRLFLCTKYTINEIELPGVPTSMQEALFMDHPEKHLGFHTGTGNPSTHGSRPAVFHGQGKQADEDEKDVLRYFQYVNNGLHPLLKENIPLVLAGAGHLLPIYRDANSYTGLLEESLEGNPDEMDEKELHQQVWKIIKPIFEKEKSEAIEQFEQLIGKGSDLAANDLKAVVKAAKYGQVETLFIPVNVQHWGRFEHERNQVWLDGKPSLENEDLLNFAAVQTILNSGQVYVLQPEDVPGSGSLAVILRYPN
ncbi:MAG: hypothetical protein R3307_00920 [Anaerolineales bacterium]|nr:hypothetical protein [Anaerolineales bacterium]